MPAMMNDQKLSDSLPTKVDDLLPPPVLLGTRRKSACFRCLAEHWTKFKRHIGTGTAPSSSSQIGESAVENSSIQRMEMVQEDGAVDEVVVDRVWSEDVNSIETHSDCGVSPGESPQVNSGGSDHESLVYEGFWSLWPPLANIRWRAWPFIMEIFSSRFIDDKSEQRYTQVSQHQLISLLMAV
jgi:osomolarity two-component system, sensor histidine kinase SLN1